MSKSIRGKLIELQNGKVFFIKYGEKIVKEKLPAAYMYGGENITHPPGTRVLLSKENLQGAKIIGFID